MDLKLKVVEGKNAGQEIPVHGKKFMIGRAEDCNMRPGSELISRHHCVLLVEDGYLAVRDFGSKNGTYVNQERVVGERELKAGDRLTVGPLQFEIHVAHNIGAKKRPPVGDIKEAAARTAQDAAQAAQDPFDVTEWLSGEEVVEQSTRDTQPSASDTDSIRLSNTQTDVPETVAETPEATEQPKSAGKRAPGKLPLSSQSSKDSQEAAAAMLSKFRKRR
jgi:predicted component of type VI protein secretion system